MILLVIRAANLLKVDEFELFRLAHKFWHHHIAEPHNIKVAFNEYLEKKVAPPWVMHFSRKVVQAYDCGNLEPAMFGIYPSYERLPFSWSLVFQTPSSIPVHDEDDLFLA
jgi:hypothetical protein